MSIFRILLISVQHFWFTISLYCNFYGAAVFCVKLPVAYLVLSHTNYFEYSLVKNAEFKFFVHNLL